MLSLAPVSVLPLSTLEGGLVSVAASAGTATATGIGGALFSGVGNAAGVAISNAISVAASPAVANSIGVATAYGIGVGAVSIEAIAGSAGGSTSAAIGASLFKALFNSAGTSDGLAVGYARMPINGSSLFRVVVAAERSHILVPADCPRQVLIPARCETVVVCFENRAMATCGGEAEGFERFISPDLYHTSLQYPLEIVDELNVSSPTDLRGSLWSFYDEIGIPYPTFANGTLEETIRYITENNAVPDELDVVFPVFGTGTLEVTIAYISLTMSPEEVQVGFPTFSDGALDGDVVFINYSNYPADQIDVGYPIMGEGTLV